MNELRFGSPGLRAPSLGALAIFVTVCCLALAANASAQTREHTLRWVQPEGPEPSGYLTYLGAESGVYSEVLDLGPVSPDPDGTRRTTLILDAYTSHYIAISAYNELGESPLSNEVFSPSAACLSSLCDDGNPCTADDCIADGCVHTPLLDGAPCDPGDGGYGLCSEAFCQPADCLLDADCDDGDACNGLETCSSNGLCISGIPLSCGEPTQCQAPACDPVLGCVLFPVADGKPCSDGDKMTKGDRCQSGVCVGRPHKDADRSSRGKPRRPNK
jgi:hypothetical protein